MKQLFLTIIESKKYIYFKKLKLLQKFTLKQCFKVMF